MESLNHYSTLFSLNDAGETKVEKSNGKQPSFLTLTRNKSQLSDGRRGIRGVKVEEEPREKSKKKKWKLSISKALIWEFSVARKP